MDEPTNDLDFNHSMVGSSLKIMKIQLLLFRMTVT
jgi:hypothetical protein